MTKRQNLKTQKKEKLIVIIMMLLTVLNTVVVYASFEEEEIERGEMRINSNVITDTRAQIVQHSSIGFEVAPFLFLANMSEMEYIRVQTHQSRLKFARNLVFTTDDHVADRLDTSEVVSMLFQETRDQTDARQGEATYTLYVEIPAWLWVIIGGVSVLSLSYIGIIIGRKISHLIHKNEIIKEGELGG
jgi:hypothetical protein